MENTTKYVEILVWPAVVLCAILLFQKGVNGLLGGDIEIKAFGVSVKGSAQQVETQLTDKITKLESKTSQLITQVNKLKGVNQSLVEENKSLLSMLENSTPIDAQLAIKSNELSLKSKALATNIDKKLSGVQQAANETKYESASELEKQGFKSFLDSDYQQAALYFSDADEAYPGYHNVREIKKLITNNLTDLESSQSEPQTRSLILSLMLEKYSWGMPSAEKLLIKKELKENKKESDK